MDDESCYTCSEGTSTYNATPIHVQAMASSTATPADVNNNNSSSSGSGGGGRASFQRFGNSHSPAAQQQTQPQLPTPTPPTIRGSMHGGPRNPRRSSEERGVRGTTTSSTTSTTESPRDGGAGCVAVAAPPLPASARASTVPSPVTTSTVVHPRTARAATSETPTGVAGRPTAAETSRQAASSNTISPATLTQLRSHIAQHQQQQQQHGLLGPVEQPKPRPPQLRPVMVARSATVERLTVNGLSNNTNNNSNTNASGETTADTRPSSAEVHHKSLSTARPTSLAPPSPCSGVVSVLEPIHTEASASFNPSLMESAMGLEGDLTAEVAETCHGFLHHLPVDWARSVVRAVTLQTATLCIPPRLLRAPAVFDAYAELRGEVSAILETAAAAAAKAARAATTPMVSATRSNSSNHHRSSRQGSSASSPAIKGDTHTAFLHTIDLQRLLTVAPALLRHRLHNTRTAKVEELRVGFRNNAQTAARTAASVNRYAYLPHVQRDVHFGAVLAQGAMRMMTPGAQLSDGTAVHQVGPTATNRSVDSNAPENGHFSPRPHAPHTSAALFMATTNNNNATTTIPVPTRTYTAVSFENFASLFLKDRFDVAQTERLGGGGNGVVGGGASSSNNNDYRHGGRRRRRINPFFERDFVATIAVGQEEAALFVTTMAPEFMVGMPSFLKHPERAVPLSLAASLHHLYSALTVELFLRAYTAAAMRNAAMAASTTAAATAGAATTEDDAAATTAATAYGVSHHTPPSEAAAAPPSLSPPADGAAVLRGPSMELGMLYVRNTIVCSASTPGMESYLVFLHQIVYPDTQGTAAASSLPSSPPLPCRALVQLSEDANGSMASPPAPPNARGIAGTFEMPTMKHAAVEMTQLVTWVQDVRSHDPRHGQPFSCHLTFVPTYIPDVKSPSLTRLCEPHARVEMDDANAFPCAVVLATADLWKALPPPEVSNLLRIFFVLDRHAQRVMELESPDYGTEEEAVAAATASASAAAAAKARDSADDDAESAAAAAASAANTGNPIFYPVAFPDPHVRQHIASNIDAQVRAYLHQIPLLQREAGPMEQLTLPQRLVSYFMARLHYYEDLNERHCKTEEETQRAELQRMARQRSAHATTANASQTAASSPSSSPPQAAAAAATVTAASTLSNYDAYEVRTKALGDALAVALAAEAMAVSVAEKPAARLADLSHRPLWLRESSQPSTRSTADSSLESAQRDEENVIAAPSVVVLLVPQRDVQRR